MIFTIKGTEKFYAQLDELDNKSKRILNNKLNLLKENPYRFKALKGYNLKLFRIRFKVRSNERRLIYTVIAPDVVLLCFIDRKKDYKDLRNIIRKFKRARTTS